MMAMVDRPKMFYGSPEQKQQQIIEYLQRSNEQLNLVIKELETRISELEAKEKQ